MISAMIDEIDSTSEDFHWKSTDASMLEEDRTHFDLNENIVRNFAQMNCPPSTDFHDEDNYLVEPVEHDSIVRIYRYFREFSSVYDDV